MGEMLECVNCNQKFDPTKNARSSCVYHPGNYGLAYPIKRGLGYSCCGRELNEGGCKEAQHEVEYKGANRHSLLEDVDAFLYQQNNMLLPPPRPNTATNAHTTTDVVNKNDEEKAHEAAKSPRSPAANTPQQAQNKARTVAPNSAGAAKPVAKKAAGGVEGGTATPAKATPKAAAAPVRRPGPKAAPKVSAATKAAPSGVASRDEQLPQSGSQGNVSEAAPPSTPPTPSSKDTKFAKRKNLPARKA